MRRFAFIAAALPAFAFGQIEYTVTPDPAAGSIGVRMSFEAKAESTELRIPAWCPGYYVIQDYQKRISDFRAADPAGKPLSISASGDRAWSVKANVGTKITASYRVLGDDPALGFFAVSVKPHTVFVNGPAAFLYASGRLQEPVRPRTTTNSWTTRSSWGFSRGGDSKLRACRSKPSS
jgi:predicted metalloprotease with PDZ domain